MLYSLLAIYPVLLLFSKPYIFLHMPSLGNLVSKQAGIRVLDEGTVIYIIFIYIYIEGFLSHVIYIYMPCMT